MSFFAPRLPARLLDEIDRLAARPDRAADICRTIGEWAEEQGFRRPSYEQVRLHVRRSRRLRRPLSTGRLAEIALRYRPPTAFVDHVSGVNTLYRSK